MKRSTLLLSALFSAALPALAQVEVVAPPVTVPAPVPGGAAVVVPPPATDGTVVVRTPSRVTVRTIDPVDAQRQLMIAPRAVVVTPPAPVPVPPPGTPNTTTTTTNRTTIVDTPGMPRRVYNEERRVVTIHEQEQARELPYVAVPVLFVKGTADLLDAESAAAIEQMAGVIMGVSRTEPNAVFDVEGHTSTEGTAEMNMGLSISRARRVHAELTQRFGVPANLLTAHGYGEMFPAFPDASEDQLQLDRRVLIVRTR